MKNKIDHITSESLNEWAEKNLFLYQLFWRQKRQHHTRFINASRMIGTTHHFITEAFENAVNSGVNQFLFAQSFRFCEHLCELITQHAEREFSATLEYTIPDKDAPFVLTLTKHGQPWASFYFIHPDALQHPSYAALSGDCYIDQVCYIDNFTTILNIAKVISCHTRHRLTLIKTGDWLDGPARDLWNKNNLYTWQHTLTVEDATHMGYDLIDIPTLKAELTEADYKRLFLCEFITQAPIQDN
jgi:hypothetical protein